MAPDAERELFGSSAYDERQARFLDKVRGQALRSEKDLNNVERGNLRAENLIRTAGFEPPAEAEGNFLYRLLDTLGTPGQYMTGIAAKLFDQNGYGKLGFHQAGLRGSAEDLNVGRLLRNAPVIGAKGAAPGWAKGIARGALGFAGDVSLDPLSYISVASKGLGPAVGGAPLSDDVIRLAGGKLSTPFQLAKEIEASKVAEAEKGFGAIDNWLKASGGDPVVAQMVKDSRIAEAKISAAAPFKDLRSHLETAKTQKGAGLKKLTASDPAAAALEAEAEALRIKKLQGDLQGLHYDDFDKIYKPRAMRFNSPFAGSATIGKIPILGAAELDIPFLTDASAKIYKTLGELPYNSAAKLSNYVQKGLENSPNNLAYLAAANLGKKLSGAGELTTKIAAEFSNRVKASGKIFGSSVFNQSIKEQEVARGSLGMSAMLEAAFRTGGLPDNPELFKDITRSIQAGTKKTGKDIAKDAQMYAANLESMRAKYNTQEGGLGDRVVNTVADVEKQFAQMADIEKNAGVLEHTINGYVHQMYTPKGGAEIPDERLYAPVKNLFSQKGASDFTAHRVFGTLEEAKLRGFEPEEDIRTILATRIYWHKRALAEKEFAERTAYYAGITKPLYERLKVLATNESSKIQNQALDVLHKMGMAQPKDILEAIPGLKANIDSGSVIDGATYDRLKTAIADPKHQYHSEALDVAKRNNLLLGKEGIPESELLVEQARLEAASQNYTRSINVLLDRGGENALTRAGGGEVNQTIRNRIKNHAAGITDDVAAKAAAEDAAKFFEGVLPQTLVEAVEDSFKTHDVLQAFHKTLATAGVKDPIAHPLYRMLKLFKGHQTLLKKGATIWWPAYWARNLMSAPFQAARGVAQLGQAFSLPNLVNVHRVIQYGKDVRTATGEIIKHGEIMAELSRLGITGSAQNQADLFHTIADQYASVMNSVPGMREVPALRRLAQQEKTGVAKFIGKAEQKISGASGVTDWAWEKIPLFRDRLEAFGRQHLYINRRMMGDDPQTAAAKVGEMMVDYAHGKTPFERNFMNNAFFFYSFSRSNASSLFHQMMERPGLLSNQFAASKELAEAVAGSADLENEDSDLGERIKSIRNREGLSHYLGTNKETGLPVVVSSTGLPVEDLSRFNAVYLPKNPTWNDLLNAGYKTASRSAVVALSQANPWLKFGVDALSGKNTYFDRPLTEKSLRKVAGFERDISKLTAYPVNKVPDTVWKTLDKGLATMLAGKPNGDGTITVNPYMMLTLTNLVPGAARFIQTRNALTKPGQKGATKAYRFGTGINVQDVNAEQSAAYDKKRELDEFVQDNDIPRTLRGLYEQQRLEDEYGSDE